MENQEVCLSITGLRVDKKGEILFRRFDGIETTKASKRAVRDYKKALQRDLASVFEKIALCDHLLEQ